MDTKKFVAALVRQGHFALYFFACLLLAIHIVYGDSIRYGKEMQVAALVLGMLGYGLGASWSPPRRPWTDEERAQRGLPPNQQ